MKDYKFEVTQEVIPVASGMSGTIRDRCKSIRNGCIYFVCSSPFNQYGTWYTEQELRAKP